MDLQLLYDEARAQLDQQLAAIDAIDAKIGVLFAVSIALGGILVAAAAAQRAPIGGYEWAAIAAFGVTCLVSVGVALAAHWGETSYTGPKARAMAQGLGEDDKRSEMRVALSLIVSYELNEPIQTWKIGLLRTGVICLTAQTALTALAILPSIGYLPAGPPTS